MTSNVLHLEIKQDLPGFEGFFSTWIVTGEPVVLVDTGPAKTADRLLAGLDALGVQRLDWILLTHIHIDHCGGAASLLERFPEARVVCHRNGLAHLVDPAKLWSGSRKVLGELADAYGAPPPIANERLVSHESVDLPGLTVIETPGHAAHHLSFVCKNHLFVGEAGGNLFYVDANPYLRPATPPRFYLETALGSVDRLLELPDMPMYYAHFEKVAGSRDMLARFRGEMIRWKDILTDVITGAPPNTSMEELEELGVETLIAREPEMSSFSRMPVPTQRREKTFIRNSVRGYLGYLKESPSSKGL